MMNRDDGYTYQNLKEMAHCSVEEHGDTGARTCPCADNLQKKEDAVGAYVRYMTKVVEWS